MLPGSTGQFSITIVHGYYIILIKGRDYIKHDINIMVNRTRVEGSGYTAVSMILLHDMLTVIGRL